MQKRTNHPDLMTRREAIFRVSAMLGGIALVGQGAMLAGCSDRREDSRPRPDREPFTKHEVAFLDEIADTILPETDTPGARAAGVGPFMALMIADTYGVRDQRIFRDGMNTIDQQSREMHGVPFMSAAPAQRLALLEQLDAEQLRYMHERANHAPAHYFRMMKELTLLGYFTSEIGYIQAMRYIETPGRYEPCVPYAPGDKAWASHA